MYLKDEFADRLRSERQRLGMTQSVFGNAVGVGRTTQKAYELAQSAPDLRYLQALERIGADVQYLLTGERSPSTSLPSDENELLTSFRAMPSITRLTVIRIVKALAEEG